LLGNISVGEVRPFPEETEMSETERWREPIAEIPSREQIEEKARKGWRPVAVEWERGRATASEDDKSRRPIPYGFRVSTDCSALEIDPVESDVVATIIALIAGDYPLSKIAAELNRKGLRSRNGEDWTQVALFRLLPRVIELGPDILSRETWSAQRESLLRAVI
jgi:hypothetical protein